MARDCRGTKRIAYLEQLSIYLEYTMSARLKEAANLEWPHVRSLLDWLDLI